MTQSSSTAAAARQSSVRLLAGASERIYLRTIDSKTIFGKNGKFKSSVPLGAVRPKPLPAPAKAK